MGHNDHYASISELLFYFEFLIVTVDSSTSMTQKTTYLGSQFIIHYFTLFPSVHNKAHHPHSTVPSSEKTLPPHNNKNSQNHFVMQELSKIEFPPDQVSRHVSRAPASRARILFSRFPKYVRGLASLTSFEIQVISHVCFLSRCTALCAYFETEDYGISGNLAYGSPGVEIQTPLSYR